MSKMASHEPFGHLQHKLWLKEGSAVKLIVWLPTTKKSGIDPIPVCAGEVRHNFEESYNFGLDLVPIRVRGEKLWASKVPRVQTEIILGLHFGSLGKKSHLDASVVESCTEYYMGEGGGFPRVRAVVSQVSPRLPVTCPYTKRVQNEF